MMKYIKALVSAVAPAIIFGLVWGTVFNDEDVGIIAGFGLFCVNLHVFLTSRKDHDDDYPCK